MDLAQLVAVVKLVFILLRFHYFKDVLVFMIARSRDAKNAGAPFMKNVSGAGQNLISKETEHARRVVNLMQTILMIQIQVPLKGQAL